MSFIHQQKATHFELNPRTTLIRLLEAENDDGRVMENHDIIVLPNGDDASRVVSLYDTNM